jgi:hypothetical protein
LHARKSGAHLGSAPLAGTRGWKPRSLAAKDGRRHVEARFQRASDSGIHAAGFVSGGILILSNRAENYSINMARRRCVNVPA